ncbi:MAG: hypothetical protein ACR2G5_05105 [Pyrinomonadaceae bacterium]
MALEEYATQFRGRTVASDTRVAWSLLSPTAGEAVAAEEYENYDDDDY